MRLIVVALLCALSGSVAFGREGNECNIAAGTVSPDFGLLHMARAIAKKRIDDVVVGSARLAPPRAEARNRP
jgi:hypothetical protein